MVRCIMAGVLALLATVAASAIDPHVEDDGQRCFSCHTQAIRAAAPQPGAYHLLTDSIDGVCLVCHRKEECCQVGQDHQGRAPDTDLGVTHPSDVRVSEVPRRHRPRTLPVFDGKITCNTCHFHDRQKPKDYKLVRLAIVKDNGVDWSRLCTDCHAEY